MTKTYVDRIINEIEGNIITGKYAPGERIPSVAQIANRYGVTTGSVRLALKRLNMRGLIYSIHGKGTFVRTADSPHSNANSKELAIIFSKPETHRPVYSPIINGIQQEAHDRGYNVIYHEVAADNHEGHQERLASLAKQKILGIIHVGALIRKNLTLLRQSCIPLILTSDTLDYNEPVYDTDIITNECYADTLQAIYHLHDLGHRRIGYLTNDDEHHWAIAFRDGVIHGLRAFGLELKKEDDFSIPELDNNRRYKKALKLSKQITKNIDDGMTAIVTVYTASAAGLTQGLCNLGIRIPQQVSICSRVCRDMDYGVPLTEDHRLGGILGPWEIIGRYAVRRLISLRTPGAKPIRHQISGAWINNTTIGHGPAWKESGKDNQHFPL